MNLRILNALGELHDEDQWDGQRYEINAEYKIQQGIDVNKVAGYCGLPVVSPITLLPNWRFDLPSPNDETVDGCIIEARGADGESVIDLCAWPVANPTDVLTLCGAAPMVGLWNALNPGTYTFDYPLVTHCSPLAWLQAGCSGAAVVIPQLAARVFLDLPGRIGAEDFDHARELRRHLDAMTNRVEIVAPKPARRMA